MADQPRFSIADFKGLPHNSSSDVGRIEDEAKRFYQSANSHYAAIFRVADLQSVISASAMEQCWDSLAAIKQIEAAFAEISDHFSNTVARQSLEFSHDQVKDLLRKATQCVKRLAAFVER